MRGAYLIAGVLGIAQALALAAVLPVLAEDAVAPIAPAPEPALVAAPAAADSPASAPAASAPDGQPSVAEIEAAPQPPHPVVEIVRAKLADASVSRGAHADDLAALQAFYGARTGAPLWTTDMGFSARGQQAIFEIEKADDWGLEAKDFALPAADGLPASPEAQALAEIALDLAILKYARFARGGRFKPLAISDLLDQELELRDPKMVLSEIDTADAPDAYLRSLHPKHEQFLRLRQALLEARKSGEDDADGADPAEEDDADSAEPAASEQDIKRLIMNMERWRWMPEDLGTLYVWHNTPEFMVHVIREGKGIYADRTLVGTIDKATPVFSADMATIVFNPDWTAPKSVLIDKLLPRLRKKQYSIIKKHRFSVSYNGKPINVAKVDWNRVDILNFTFIQRAGPGNNLGKIKFLYPNKHDVYMHDTLDVRRKYFKETERDIGYGCVRMEKPAEFAQTLLAEDKGWPASQVKEIWDGSATKSISLDHKIPVHTTYFTALVDETGKVATYADLYGLDHKLAKAMFGTADGFPMPAPKPKQEYVGSSVPVNRTTGGGIAGSLGFLD